MKLEVHTLRFGSPDWLPVCQPTLEAWCQRHGYELTVWDGEEFGHYPCPKFCEKDAIEAFLAGDADAMLYVDADVYVNPRAPEFPELKGLALATDNPHREHNEHWRTWCQENYGEFFDEWDYSNAGVWFVDRTAAAQLLAKMQPPFIEMFQEQHAVNYWAACAHRDGMEFTRLPDKWNRYGKDLEPSWFFHLWGTTKLEDFTDIQKSGILSLDPSETCRYNIRPPKWPPSDKVVVHQFVQDCGLGNQLFELATSYGIAKRLGLPLRWSWPPSRLRDFGLEAFGLGQLPFRHYPIVSSKLGQGNRMIVEQAVERIQNSGEKYCAISHPFQAEECFADVADEIRGIFKLEPFPLDVPAGKTPVGVQVRRGDYIGHSKLCVTNEQYFRNAVRFIRGKIEAPHFFMVSDDPAWCRETFGNDEAVTVMPEQSPIDGLRTLASCDAHIISNSTFGWWGAWLGEKGPVVAPEIWHHKPGSYGDWNPVPERWHRVSIEAPPELERAIVYPWKSTMSRWHELRYSLRSIEANFADKDCPIFILGDKPPHWMQWEKRGKPIVHRVKWIDAPTYEDALNKGVRLANEVLWMNDDVVLLKPCDWDTFRTAVHHGPFPLDKAHEWIESSNDWKKGVGKAIVQLRNKGIAETLNFGTHVPYLYEREKALEIFKLFPIGHKAPMETLYHNWHGTPSVDCGDFKTNSFPFGDATILNHNDGNLTPDMRLGLQEMFPEKALWEFADVPAGV